MASISPQHRKHSSHTQRRHAQQRQARKAKRARARLRHLHDRLPTQARTLLGTLAPAFTRPTFLRFVVLLLAASSPSAHAPSPTFSAPSTP
jgi:hypothetical protein